MAYHTLLVGSEADIELESVAAVRERQIKCSYCIFRSVAAGAAMAEQKRFGRVQFAGKLIEIEVANERLVNVRAFFGAAQCLLELFLQQITALLFRFHRLAEDGITPAFLLVHGARGLVQIAECLGPLGRDMTDNRVRLSINFQQPAAAWTGHLKLRSLRPSFRHGQNDTAECWREFFVLLT